MGLTVGGGCGMVGSWRKPMHMPSSKPVKLVVSQPDDKPVPRHILATAIVEISRAMNKLIAGGLNREAVVILTQHSCRGVGPGYTKPTQTVVREVFRALSELERDFCK